MNKNSGAKKFWFFTIFYIVSVVVSLFIGGRYLSAPVQKIISFNPFSSSEAAPNSNAGFLSAPNVSIEMTKMGNLPGTFSLTNVTGRLTNNMDKSLEGIMVDLIVYDQDNVQLDGCTGLINMELKPGSTAQFEAYCSLDSASSLKVSKVKAINSSLLELTFEQK